MKAALLTAAIFAAWIAVVFLVLPANGTPPASPIHQANVFFDGGTHYDFRQTCSVVYIPGATPAQCEAYFAQTTVIAGANIAHAVPHSEKIKGTAAVVRGKSPDGTTYTIREQLRRGVWKLTSVTSP